MYGSYIAQGRFSASPLSPSRFLTGLFIAGCSDKRPFIALLKKQFFLQLTCHLLLAASANIIFTLTDGPLSSALFIARMKSRMMRSWKRRRMRKGWHKLPLKFLRLHNMLQFKKKKEDERE